MLSATFAAVRVVCVAASLKPSLSRSGTGSVPCAACQASSMLV